MRVSGGRRRKTNSGQWADGHARMVKNQPGGNKVKAGGAPAVIKSGN
jgi:hypothetical protein